MHYATLLGDPQKVIGITTANLMLDVLFFSLLIGMNGALETLVSQAHGAK